MLVHAFVVLCLALNPTMCREQEIVPFDYSKVLSVRDCMYGYALYATQQDRIIDDDGAEWTVRGVRCRTDGSIPTTDIQRRLRAAISP